jgi:phosphohistidine phosphatase
MRTLYLLRHAKSSLQVETVHDFDRPLTKRGREAAEVVGQAVAAEKLNSALVLSSPAMRARETTEIMLQSSKLAAELHFDPQIYEADLSALLKILGQIEDQRDVVILIGHNPGMETLVRFLTGEIRAMPTAALGKIVFEGNSWRSVTGGEGRLEWLITPNDSFDA